MFWHERMRIRRAIPLAYACRLMSAKTREVVSADVRRWIEVTGADRRGVSSLELALALIASTYPEFRNLLYYRLQRDRLARYVVPLLAAVWKPMPTLYLQTPRIGPGMFIQHGFSTIVAAESIGSGFWVNQQVTIGFSDETRCPVIGDNVRVHAGAIVVGDVVLGDNSTIGAGAVVVKDVPASCVVVGVPAHPTCSETY